MTKKNNDSTTGKMIGLKIGKRFHEKAVRAARIERRGVRVWIENAIDAQAKSKRKA